MQNGVAACEGSRLRRDLCEMGGNGEGRRRPIC